MISHRSWYDVIFAPNAHLVGWTHIAQSYLSLLFTGIIKSEKERLISLFKCADKFENGQYGHWSSFSICQNPTPIHFNKYPFIGIPPNPLTPHPNPSEHSLKEVHNVNHIVYWLDRPPFPVCVKTLFWEVKIVKKSESCSSVYLFDCRLVDLCLGWGLCCIFYFHGKHLWSCRDSQLTYPHFSWAGLDLLSG